MSIRKFLISTAIASSLVVPTLAFAQVPSACSFGSTPTIANFQACIAYLVEQIALMQQQQPQTGGRLQDGSNIETSVHLRVRATPSVTALTIGTATIGSTGTIRCSQAPTPCPATSSGYTWWYIDWDSPSIPSGWSVQGSSEAIFLADTTGRGGTDNTGAPTIITTNLPGASVNQAYSASVSASGGVGSYAWSITSGSLPPGLSLQPISCSTTPCQAPIYITGTPTTAGAYTFTIQVANGRLTSSRSFTIAVGQAGGQQGQTPTGQTGSGRIQVTLDGAVVNSNVVTSWLFPGGVSMNTPLDLPLNYVNQPVGNYQMTYVSGGPGGSFKNITDKSGAVCRSIGASTCTQTLIAGGDILFSINFTTLASLNPVSAPVTTSQAFDWRSQAEQAKYGACYSSSVNSCRTAKGYPTDASAFVFRSGNTADDLRDYHFTCPNQSRSACADVIPSGTVEIKTLVNGVPWNGSIVIYVDWSGPDGQVNVQTGVGTGARVGTYKLTYVSGGPGGAIFQNIDGVGPTVEKTLNANGTITFTFNFTK